MTGGSRIEEPLVLVSMPGTASMCGGEAARPS